MCPQLHAEPSFPARLSDAAVSKGSRPRGLRRRLLSCLHPAVLGPRGPAEGPARTLPHSAPGVELPQSSPWHKAWHGSSLLGRCPQEVPQGHGGVRGGGRGRRPLRTGGSARRGPGGAVHPRGQGRGRWGRSARRWLGLTPEVTTLRTVPRNTGPAPRGRAAACQGSPGRPPHHPPPRLLWGAAPSAAAVISRRRWCESGAGPRLPREGPRGRWHSYVTGRSCCRPVNMDVPYC